MDYKTLNIEIDIEKCYGILWNNGKGKQCSQKKKEGNYCTKHNICLPCGDIYNVSSTPLITKDNVPTIWNIYKKSKSNKSDSESAKLPELPDSESAKLPELSDSESAKLPELSDSESAKLPELPDKESVNNNNCNTIDEMFSGSSTGESCNSEPLEMNHSEVSNEDSNEDSNEGSNEDSNEGSNEDSNEDSNEENEFNSHILNKYTVGDNLEILKNMEENSVHMIYMDPPYNTGRDFGDFNDKYDDYYNFMKLRIKECHRILKKSGNIIIHVEAKISHHIRYICDEIFGATMFKNEIIWKTGGNVKNKYQLGRSHDNIIVYSKTNKSKFNPMYIPYDKEEVEKYPLCPHHNMRYGNSAAHTCQPHVNPRPNLRYTWNGNYNQWLICEEKMNTLHDDHRLVYNKKGIPRIKRFFEEQSGIPIRDLWNDISSIQAKEKTNYATQKPIKLLDRIINLYSDKNDICLDPFAGSGTLGRTCIKNERKYILFDINEVGKSIFEESIS